jgi:hypothetical protein
MQGQQHIKVLGVIYYLKVELSLKIFQNRLARNMLKYRKRKSG